MKANVILLAVTTAFLMASCGVGNKELLVKNDSNEFSGALRDYLELVDGSYSISDAGYDVIMTAKFKVLKPIEEGTAFNSIRAEVLDEGGMPIPGANTFVIAKDGWTKTESENAKIDNALTDGEGEVSVQFKYDTYSTGGGSLGDKDFMKSAKRKPTLLELSLQKLRKRRLNKQPRVNPKARIIQQKVQRLLPLQETKAGMHYLFHTKSI